jgi:uncharacterized OsmC-like protein
MEILMEYVMNEHGFETEFEHGLLKTSSNDQYGFRPFQLLISSITTCSGGVLRKVLMKKRIAFDDLKIRVDVTRNPSKVNRIEKIHLHFIIHGRNLNHETIQKALSLAKKNCPMVQSVKDSIEITECLELIPTVEN